MKKNYKISETYTLYEWNKTISTDMYEKIEIFHTHDLDEYIEKCKQHIMDYSKHDLRVSELFTEVVIYTNVSDKYLELYRPAVYDMMNIELFLDSIQTLKDKLTDYINYLDDMREMSNE